MKVGASFGSLIEWRCPIKFVEASTPKFGEWAERWDSREPRNGTGAKYHNSKGFYCTGFARIPAFGQLSKFGGGRLYLDGY